MYALLILVNLGQYMFILSRLYMYIVHDKTNVAKFQWSINFFIETGSSVVIWARFLEGCVVLSTG